MCMNDDMISDVGSDRAPFDALRISVSACMKGYLETPLQHGWTLYGLVVLHLTIVHKSHVQGYGELRWLSVVSVIVSKSCVS